MTSPKAPPDAPDEEVLLPFTVRRPVAKIGRNFRKGLLGTHHMSTDGKTMVIDHLSYSFVP